MTASGPYGAVVERSHCATTTLRRARKRRTCESCLGDISPGSAYLLHKAFPGHDSMSCTRPVTMAECSVCVERYGRGHLLLPANDSEARS